MTPARIREIPFTLVHFHLDYLELDLLDVSVSRRKSSFNGKKRDRIGSIVEELGLNDITSFPGGLSRDILPAYYAAADVCVVPSHYEPFTLAMIACGTPLVASDAGGLKYTVVPRETGLLAPPKNEAVFADAIAC